MSATATLLPCDDRPSRRKSPPAAARCRHCGTPSGGDEFCCAGCAYVFRLVHEAGCGAYYEIKDTITTPAVTALLPAGDHDWLTAAQRAAEATADGHTPALLVSVQGISCAGCVWLIEKIFARQPGAGRIEVNAQTGQAQLSWMRGAFDAAAFATDLQRFNYLLGPAEAARAAPSEARGLAQRTGLCAAFAMNVMLFTLPGYFGMESTAPYARLFGTLSMVFATLSLLAGGGYFLNRAWRALVERSVHIDLPIALGIVGAFGGSLYGWLTAQEAFIYFDFVSAFILLMLVGRWAQTAAIERNQRRLLALQPAPSRVRALESGGGTVLLPPDQLVVGQRYLAGPGAMIPVESRLDSTAAECSLAWINGEAEPRLFHRQQRIPAGAQNLMRGDIRLVVERTWARSLLAQLTAPTTRAPFRHRAIERVIQAYLIAILGLAFAAGAGWWWFSHGDLGRTGAVVVAILVVSCPCALGLAFPLCDEIATVALRRRGVFVRTADLWPRLACIRRVIFDKTGTLTLETPLLDDPAALQALDPAARAALCALVQDTPHPVARALHEQLLAQGPVEPMPGVVEETIGCGVALGNWRLGRGDWATGEASRSDLVDTVLSCDRRVVARFAFTDAPRRSVRGELSALAARGLEVSILSGDRREKVAALAEELGLPRERAHGECSPADKAAWLDAHEGGTVTMMLGDGANDSLAFDRALCRGTPVVHRGVLQRKADFFYLGHGIGGIRALFEVNDARTHTQRGLLVFMILYNVVAVGLALAGRMNPLLAAVLMPASSLLTLALVGWGMRPVWR